MGLSKKPPSICWCAESEFLEVVGAVYVRRRSPEKTGGAVAVQRCWSAASRICSETAATGPPKEYHVAGEDSRVIFRSSSSLISSVVLVAEIRARTGSMLRGTKDNDEIHWC
ncbi:uncharacterized protein LOC127242228 [Andrographis paniculata]|uniref:uncharacterized protein LOC127242228 n=1 Tax=Andrographis paniculata TaxID=175694 RepID=UPI0021E7B473|nr:uncharacterized protein LOC127242228 [Andrographis paniculata]